MARAVEEEPRPAEAPEWAEALEAASPTVEERAERAGESCPAVASAAEPAERAAAP